ncbi:phage tail protein I [Pandoraea cepalis]|uniref:Phage tail protein I n=1 Tax=Pandoraea cepalis TaxID=2508294 RepID=A0AAW7MIU2_9BURK|nr:phage tail protein I [Pandoraea cepalis]MDN4572679.1 phage tail protein I [Pandoraea cepalis]MDN4577094.1 phage tail protein I [Pandoraea cepalis]
MAVDLLPPNATPLERAVARALADLAGVPIPLRDLWNIDRCPVKLLPYLAWTFSVDRWDDTWSEATKRDVIRRSFWLHKRKGTIGALRRAVEPLGYLIEVIEWWQHAVEEPRGTFRLRVGVLDTGITEAMYQELERLIDDAKPASRHLLGLDISLESQGSARVGVTAYDGDTLNVYPYFPEDISVVGQIPVGGASHIIDIMSTRQ